MKNVKRYLAVILTVLITLTSFPIMALAEEKHADAQGQTDEFIWNYDSKTDTLYINTINGHNELYYDQWNVEDYGYLPTYTSQEARDNKEHVWDSSFVSHIVIGKDIEYINDSCIFTFYEDYRDKTPIGYRNLETITFEAGSKLKEIGEDVFCCTNAKRVELPYGLEKIEQLAFEAAMIEEIVIPDTVYYIDDCAFEGSAVKKVTFPSYKGDKETYFGYALFNYCENLTEIDFGTTITEIPENAFSYCSSLKSVVIPDRITKLDNEAFLTCENLEYIRLPKNLTYIGDYGFAGCTKLSNVDFSRVKNNVEFGFRAFAGCASLTSIDMPTAPSKIGSYCFAESGLTSIDTGTVIDEIDEYAFSECKNLTSFDLTNVRKIGSYAFKDSGLTGMDAVKFSGKLEEIGAHAFEGTGITKLDLKDTNIYELPERAFCSESNLTEIILPDNLNVIGQYALAGTSITELDIPDSVTTLGSYFCMNCPELEWVNFSYYSCCTVIPYAAFYNCPNLTSVDFTTNIKTINGSAFEKCTNLQWMNDTESLEVIGNKAFYGCNQLNEIYIADTLTSIGEYAFANASYLNEFDLSKCDNLTTLGKGAFKNVKGLSTFKFPKNASVSIPDEFLANTALTKVVIPRATSIGQNAFDGAQFKEITLPDNCKTISQNAFANCTQLETIRMPYAYVPGRLYSPFSNNPKLKTVIYPSREAFTYDERLYTTHRFLANSGLTVQCYEDTDIQRYCEKHNINYEILTEELENNFSGNSTIAVTNQGTCTNGTWRLYQISKSDTRYILEINVDGDIVDDNIVCDSGRRMTFNDLFRYRAIGRVYFSEGVTSIPDNFFYQTGSSTKSALDRLQFPSTLVSIGKNAFRNLYALSKVNIPDNVKEVGEYAFANNLQLHEVHVGSGVTEIKEGTFYRSNPCLSSGNILSEGLKSIGKKAFAGITKTGDGSRNLITFRIPESVEYIYGDPIHPEDNAFGFNELGVIYDEKVAFKVHYGTAGYNYVKQYCLPYTLLSGEETEEEKNYVPEIDYRDINWGYLSSVNNINNAKYGLDYSQIRWSYNKLSKTLTINAGSFMKTIGTLGFFRGDKTQVKPGDYEVDTIIINGINTIYANEKDPLLNLSMFNPKNIVVSSSVTTINKNAFKDCTRLESFTFPNSVTSIDGTIFKNCNSLKSVTFGSGIKNIPASILYNCTDLEYVTIPEGCVSIGGNAFRNCNNLHEINIPDTVKTIGNYAFYKDLGLNKITLGKGVNVIGCKAFYGTAFCQKLIVNSDLFISDTEAKIKKNESFGMLGASTTGAEVTFGDTATANLAGFINANISEIKLSENVKEVKNIISLPKLSKISADESSKYFHSFDNALYTNDNALVLAPRNVISISIEDGTKSIGENAFANSAIKTVTIPDSVKAIDNNAFADCDNLKTVTFGDKLETIGDNAFKNCSKIKFVYFHDGLISIGSGAFDGATNLASVIFNEGVTSIGNSAFANCISLKDVVISESVESIGDRAFADCNALERIYIFDSTIEKDIIADSENAKLYVLAGSTPYALAREYGVPYYAYTDEDCFYDDVAVKLDSLAGYLGYCENGHGDIQYLTVYEPSCTQDGYVIGVCEYCSVILEEKHIDACGHNYVNTVSISATATTQGVDQYRCTNCGDAYTVYSSALDGEVADKTMCTITGKAVIANDKEATKGSTPLAAVSVSLGGETLATSDKNGDFTFNLETGTYELVMHYSYGFDRTIYVVVTDSNIDLGTIPMIACDWNKDGVIDDDDYTIFKLVIGATSDSPSYLGFVDMNNDGRINVKDLVYMNNVKGLDSSGFEYPELVYGV